MFLSLFFSPGRAGRLAAVTLAAVVLEPPLFFSVDF